MTPSVLCIKCIIPALWLLLSHRAVQSRLYVAASIAFESVICTKRPLLSVSFLSFDRGGQPVKTRRDKLV